MNIDGTPTPETVRVITEFAKIGSMFAEIGSVLVGLADIDCVCARHGADGCPGGDCDGCPACLAGRARRVLAHLGQAD